MDNRKVFIWSETNQGYYEVDWCDVNDMISEGFTLTVDRFTSFGIFLHITI